MTTSLPHLLTLPALQVMDLLGMRRAEACRRALEERGVDASRFTTAARSADKYAELRGAREGPATLVLVGDSLTVGQVVSILEDVLWRGPPHSTTSARPVASARAKPPRTLFSRLPRPWRVACGGGPLSIIRRRVLDAPLLRLAGATAAGGHTR